MSIKATKQYYSMPFAGLCGILLDEKTMKKVAKLVYRQNQELKELLQTNIENIEVSNWTLAYPNGEQEVVYHIEATWETKERRISFVDRLCEVLKVDHVYFGNNEDAKNEHMKLYDDNTEVGV